MPSGPITIVVDRRRAPGVSGASDPHGVFNIGRPRELLLFSSLALIQTARGVSRIKNTVVNCRMKVSAAGFRCSASPRPSGTRMSCRIGRDELKARLQAAGPVILPSLLACDFTNLEREVKAVEEGGRRPFTWM